MSLQAILLGYHILTAGVTSVAASYTARLSHTHSRSDTIESFAGRHDDVLQCSQQDQQSRLIFCEANNSTVITISF